MADKNGQTSTNNTDLFSALSHLEYSLQSLKTTDAWFDEVEALNADLGVENVMDRELHRRCASNAVSLWAQEVVDLSKSS